MLSRLSFARQMLVLQLLVVVAVIAASAATYGFLLTQSSRDDAQSSALAIARAVAEDTELRAAVAVESLDPAQADGTALADGPVQRAAEAVRVRTGALFVVVTDDRGMRLAHPDPARLGERVSTDPSVALAGGEEVSWERGTLGDSARAKVPIFADDGSVLGEVSVGFGAESVLAAISGDIAGLLGVAAAALLLGLLATLVLSRRLRRLTLGLQPAELAAMAQDQAAVLTGIGEGVVGLSPDGRVTVCNERAARLLRLEEALGHPVGQLDLPQELAEALTGLAAGQPDASLRVGWLGRLLFIDASRVFRDGLDLGIVVVVRDETDLDEMAGRLSAVSAMTNALRVQRHEFANRMHVVSGLIATGRPESAAGYLRGILERGPVDYPVVRGELLTEPTLQAFVGAKALEAGERGVEVRIGEDTGVHGILVGAETAVTVLGNLLDNAVGAAVTGASPLRWIEIDVLDDGDTLHLVVADSGDGVSDPEAVFHARPLGAPEAGREDIADDRIRGIGVGLRLSRDLARRGGGDLWLADPGGDGAGAVFVARLVGVVRDSSTMTEERE